MHDPSFELGPGEYLNESVLQTLGSKAKQAKSKDDKQFGIRAKRFVKADTISPGPGTYKLKQSCEVRNPKIEMASYKSAT